MTQPKHTRQTERRGRKEGEEGGGGGEILRWTHTDSSSFQSPKATVSQSTLLSGHLWENGGVVVVLVVVSFVWPRVCVT